MLADLMQGLDGLDDETDNFDLNALRSSFTNVDEALNGVEDVLGSLRSWEAPLATEVASHLVTAGGKRLRPALLFLTYRASGGEDLSEAKPYAVASELIHTSTLLHDDVIDQGMERRGVETANQRFGNLNAVLSGDYLVAHVMAELLSLGRIEPARHLAVVMTQLVQGEILQEELAYDSHVGTDQFIRATKLKTSSLFSYSAWCGSYLAQPDSAQPRDLASYAEHLGVAFQIVDDVLDYESEQTGKTPLSDLKDGRANFPLILAMKDNPALRRRFNSLNTEESPSRETLEEFQRLVRESGALKQAREEARKQSSRAKACLENVPKSEHRNALEKISDFVYQRIR